MKKTYWCGFRNGKPDFQMHGFDEDGNAGIWPQLFKSKKLAKEFHDDVRKVTIEEVTK